MPQTTNEQGRLGRGPSLILGSLLILVGIPMLVCPGPGLGAIVAGAALVWHGLGGKAESSGDGAGTSSR